MLTSESPLPIAQANAEELTTLAHHEDFLIRAAVARHPNTPVTVLGALAADHPEEVLHNPALPLVLLARSPDVARWPAPALLALIACPGAPDALLVLAARHPDPDVQGALACRNGLPWEALGTLARSDNWDVRARIARQPALPLPLIAQFARDADYGVRRAVAARPELPGAVRSTLTHDPHPLVRAAARSSKESA
ncbi:hypothetical protein [Deinococcus hopiensis]|uniref:Leucine rich repeat variant n=1 Tax=Deinococcus hopiensis KR-140 TaxID=695939 RepID=A0A1W1UUU6_9DEIO|nr:hypothetical protein [Deinococcus hopiensis]SMB84494.1 Leucine rich repeat variant [Deinococcus hopiensis KR-140]